MKIIAISATASKTLTATASENLITEALGLTGRTDVLQALENSGFKMIQFGIHTDPVHISTLLPASANRSASMTHLATERRSWSALAKALERPAKSQDWIQQCISLAGGNVKFLRVLVRKLADNRDRRQSTVRKVTEDLTKLHNRDSRQWLSIVEQIADIMEQE